VLPFYRALTQPFWHRHKWHAAVACSVVLLQSMLVMALMAQARRRRLAERDAEQQRQQLTHLTRVGVLGELSGALAHELNQPLSAILSNAQAARLMLEQEPVNLSEISDILDDIVQDDSRAGGVIDRLRSLMKKGDASFQPLDLNSVVREVLDLAYSDLIGRNVAVNMDFSRYLPAVRGDKVQLQQLLLNLVMNACDAMDSVERSNKVLTLSTSRDGNGAARVSIVDRGPGVSPTLASRVFEPFFTTKQHGLGLGLSICRTIVVAHNGSLEISNTAGGGATFSVTLPSSGGGRL
jgi:C4-dicarboxylate-specific signal transduction histidine kinase